ncbi:MAG: DUF4258 domain-containing protein [Chloroflexi bacterium]|nr:DUF4258 domain-containing protein [Chloroflexota bacterium]
MHGAAWAMMDCDNIDFSRHAIQRMFERAVSPTEVRAAVATGEVVAVYPDDKPHPSVLILAFVHDKPLHVVVSQEARTSQCHVITVYVPDPSVWSSDFKARRRT